MSQDIALIPCRKDEKPNPIGLAKSQIKWLSLITCAAIAANMTMIQSAKSQISPEIKKECMKAADFAGCVKTLSGEKTGLKSITTIDLDKINSSGNSCPSGWAYIGSGYCKEVLCGFVGYHDQRLGGKGWSCKGLSWFNKDLELGNTPVRATYTSKCPDVEPDVGLNSSCQNGMSEQQLINSR